MSLPTFESARAWRTACVSAALLCVLSQSAHAQSSANPYRRLAVLQSPANAAQIVPADVFGPGTVVGAAQIKTGQTTRYYVDGLRVIAVKENTFRYQPTLWDVRGVPTALPPLSSGVDARAWSMNSSGVTVGESKTFLDRTNGVAVVWRNGKAVDLGAGARSSARHINASGVVLGHRALTSASLSDLEFFVGKDKATLKWLKPLPAGATSLYCLGLTDAGQVVCRSNATVNGDLQFKSHVWTNGVFSEIVSPAGGEVLAMAVSPSGIVAGYVNLPDNSSRGFTWQNGQWRWLPDPPLPAPVRWDVYDVNDRGEVLLSAYTVYQYNSTNYLWDGMKHVAVSDLVADREPAETVGASRLGPQGEVLVDIQSKVNGVLQFKQAIYAP
jgi:uncharacterized membrane protein